MNAITVYKTKVIVKLNPEREYVVSVPSGVEPIRIRRAMPSGRTYAGDELLLFAQQTARLPMHWHCIAIQAMRGESAAVFYHGEKGMQTAHGIAVTALCRRCRRVLCIVAGQDNLCCSCREVERLEQENRELERLVVHILERIKEENRELRRRLTHERD